MKSNILGKAKDILLNKFLIIYIVYYITLFLDATSLEIDYKIIELLAKMTRYFTYFLFIGRFIILVPEYKKIITEKRWKDKDNKIKAMYILAIIILVCLVVNFVITRNKRLPFLILILLSAYGTDYKKIIKTTMILQIALTSIIVTLSTIGITQNYIVARDEIKRSSLGFVYTTNLAQMILFSSILYLYDEGFKTRWLTLIGIQLLNVFTYFITNSRTEFILIEFILIIMVICKLLEKYKKVDIINKVKKLYSSLFKDTFVIYPVFSLLMVVLYKFGGIWQTLNNILSNRLKQTYENIVLYGIRPFGQKIEFIGLGLKERIQYGTNYSSNFVDNEYLQLMLSEGVIFTVCFIAIFSILLKMLYDRKKYKEIILCSIYLLFGLINPRIVNVLYCPILFMIIPTIMEYRKKEKTKKEMD